jgi:hypothetical protein
VGVLGEKSELRVRGGEDGRVDGVSGRFDFYGMRWGVLYGHGAVVRGCLAGEWR